MFNILTSTQVIGIELIVKTFISISAYPSVGTVKPGVVYVVLIFGPNPVLSVININIINSINPSRCNCNTS